MYPRYLPASVILVLFFAAGVVTAQEASVATTPKATTETGDDTAAVKAAIQSYVAAFNARDAKKLTQHWSPQGVYISRSSGEQVVGHESLAAEFTAMFAGESVPQIAVATESIEFISPNVALEKGTATVTHAEDDVVESNYRVIYVRSNGAWLIDRVTDDEIVVTPSNYDQLKGLEWMVGEWLHEVDGRTFELTCAWTKNQNYVSRKYTVSTDGNVESSGLQIIGWDPKEKKIRSWLFDSDGGFVEGSWTQRDDRWIVQSVATLADSGSGSFTGVYRPLEDGSFAWKKINQVVDGQLLPNLEEVIVHQK